MNLPSIKAISQNKIFVSTYGDCSLYEVDVDKCSARFIVKTNCWTDIAITPSGQIFGVTDFKVSLIDTFNGTYTTYSNDGKVVLNSLEAIDDTTLIIAGNNVNTLELYKYNLKTKKHTLIGQLENKNSGGDLVWYDDILYLATYDKVLIKLIFNSTYTALTSFNTVSAIPSPGGLAVKKNADGVHSLIGFGSLKTVAYGDSDTAVYQLCHLNTNTVKLCPNLNIKGSILGAASLRMANQSPPPTKCYGGIAHIDNSVNSNLEFIIGEKIQLKSDAYLDKIQISVYSLEGKSIYQSKWMNGTEFTLNELSKDNTIKLIVVSQNGQAITRKMIQY